MKTIFNKLRNKLFLNAINHSVRSVLNEEMPALLKKSLGDRGEQQQDMRIILHEELPKIFNSAPVSNNTPVQSTATVSELLANRFRTLQPIDNIHIKNGPKRINLVTDSISKDSLLGGDATATIVATEFARKNGYILRIITRNAPPEPEGINKILEINGFQEFTNIEFYTDCDKKSAGERFLKLDISENDVFFATSWWSACAIKGMNLRKRFFYIIQEVETFFYPHGDDHYLCSEIMQDENIDFIINHNNLRDYFEKNAPVVFKNGIAFTPAFSRTLYHVNSFKPKKRYRLFFYSRPNNPRNMFWYGVKMLDLAIKLGILNTSEWDIYCAGQDTPVLIFSDGYKAINMGLMSWKEYGKFLEEIDLTLSLMYTPHPSYPPYDAACAGSVVLTNECLNKKDFPECKNILTTKLDEEVFMQNFAKAIALAKNLELRKENFDNNKIPANWEENLRDVMQFMEARV